MTRRQVEVIFKKHCNCTWWDAFKFTDCKVNIITELVELSNKKPKIKLIPFREIDQLNKTELPRIKK